MFQEVEFMSTCSRCGAANRKKAKFCAYCGAPLQTSWQGKAAKGVREMASQRLLGLLGGLALYLIIVALAIAATKKFLHQQAAIGVGSFMAVLGLSFFLPLARRLRHALQGAEGEEIVARFLESLPPPWETAHDVFLGNFNVDHLVFGPSGVFVIETKNPRGVLTIREGRLFLDGRPLWKNPVKQAKRVAVSVAKELEKVLGKRVFVQAVVCFALARLEEPQNLDGVLVVNALHLREIFQGVSARVLNSEDIARIKVWLEKHRYLRDEIKSPL
jgi:hypothetical protein